MGKHGYALSYARQLPQFEEFLATKKADKTRESYSYALGHFAEFLSKLNGIQIGDVSTWNEFPPAWFYQSLVDNGKSWSTEQVHMHAVMQYLKHLERQNALPFSTKSAKAELKVARDHTVSL